jgi:hypothetical protein
MVSKSTGSTWQREITAALAPLGLTHVQFVLLAAAWWLNSRGDCRGGCRRRLLPGPPRSRALLAMLRTLAQGGG